MMIRRDRRAPSRLGVALASLVVILAACGGTPSAAPTGTPGPTPTPIDVKQALISTVTAAAFGATGTIAGTVTVGKATGAIVGTFKGNADAFEQALTLTLGSTTASSDRIAKVDGGFERFGAGPWLALPPPSDPPVAESLLAWLRGLTDLEISGTESRGGTPATKLVPLAESAPVPPEAIGFDGAEVTSPVIAVSIFAATATGAPLAVDVNATWTQPVLGVPTPATYAFSYAFASAGSEISIETPTDVWTLNANPALGYQMAMPAGWSVAADADRDTYTSPAGGHVTVRANANAKGLTLDEFRAAITATYHTEFGNPESMTKSTLSIAPANFLRYGVSAGGGTPHALLDRIALHGAGWEVAMVTPAGPTAADLDLFDIFCASFAFTK